MKNYKSFKRDAKENDGETASRDEIIEKLLKGNERRAYALAFNLLKNSDDAKDLVQEAACRVLRHWEKYDPLRSFGGWYLTIIRNVFIDARREAAHLKTVSLDRPIECDENISLAETLADGEISQHERLEQAETARIVIKALEALPSFQRDILTLCDVEGQDYENAARITGVPVGTIKSRLSRARRSFRREIKIKGEIKQ
jgi:RNA polymerase sigma-70 factor (ECF subfamily)